MPTPGKPVFELWTDRHPNGELHVVSVRGVEQISRPFSFEILFTGEPLDPSSAERELLGQRATLWLRGDSDEVSRPVHGVLRRVEVEGISGGGEHRHRYRCWLVPRLWLLGRGRMSRIFQDLTVPEIVAAVLAGQNVPCSQRLLRRYAPRRYCVQHQESDLAFVRRLCAEEGIFYWFEHTAPEMDLVAALGALFPGVVPERDIVVLGDEPGSIPSIDGPPGLTFRDSGGMAELDEDVRRFRTSVRAAVGSTRISEYDHLRPSLEQSAVAEVPRSPAGSVAGAIASGIAGAMSGGARGAIAGAISGALGGESFDWSRVHDYDHHGEVEGARADPAAAERRLSQLRVRSATGQGESRCRRLQPGRWFELTGDALRSLDGRYTVTRVEHEGHSPEAVLSSGPGGGVRDVYRNRFECVPERVAPRPKVARRRIQQVMETATVVGAGAQQIHTDALGRVKVQFHWDRAGQKNQHSSCWIRTVQAWAGDGFGFQFIPRIGMEVMVVFLAGDTDRPVVVGAVYNAEHPPPFPLPAHKTRSGIRTRTSPGTEGFNELSFEDRAGYERVYVHAQRDLELVAVHDQTSRVGHQRTDQVTGNRVALVGGNDLTSIGGSATRTIAGDDADVVDGHRSSRVGGDVTTSVTGRAHVRVAEDLHTRVGGSEQREVGGATTLRTGEDHTVRVEGCLTTLVGASDHKRSFTLHVEGSTSLSGSGPTEIRSDSEILLRCGKSLVHITPERIDIVSPTVSVQAAGAMVTAGDDELAMKTTGRIVGVSDDKVVFRGSGAGVTLSADARVDGSQVHLGSGDSASLSRAEERGEPTTIELVDDRGEPIPHQRYVIVQDGGEQRSGMLDADGKATIHLEESAKIVFPGLPGAEEA